ncbi:hypothetical protein [Bacillus pseudomycoides]|nr:hypothetical protein [Bacillus pseudomycoides]
MKVQEVLPDGNRKKYLLLDEGRIKDDTIREKCGGVHSGDKKI